MSNLLKISFLSLLLLLSFSAEAQRGKKKKNREPEPIVQKYETPKYEIKVAFDADSLMHGPYEYYFKEKLQAKGQYEHGTKVGDWVYTPDDTIKIVGSYDENGKKRGNWKYYYQTNLVSDLYYTNGVFNGTQKGFFKTGELGHISKYIDGKEDSVFTSFYPNGKIQTLIEYKDGKIIGQFIEYDEDGTVLNKIEYKNGHPYQIIKLNDDVEIGYSFYISDIKNGTGYFKIARQLPEDRVFIERETNYAEGLPNGTFYIYKTNDEIEVKGQHLNGFMSGTWVKYPNKDNQLNPIIKNYAVEDSIEVDNTFVPSAKNVAVGQYLVQDQPAFPGGDRGMISFLGQQVGYPPIARESGSQGKFFMRFVVEPDGSLSNAEVLKIIGFEIDKVSKFEKRTAAELQAEVRKEMETACLNAIKKMPYFRPGFQNGIPVRVRVIVPLVFRLQ